MRSTALKPLLNLAAAALIAGSTSMPDWGAHLLSCGFTHALRTIQSAEAIKQNATPLAGFDRS
ncbi:MAG: hypothetical protein ACREV9_01625 [Burkholderiales bacterium]